jgi:phosphoribosylglycinamide formyltransferase-1
MRIVVFASGRGSNFEAILNAVRDGVLSADIVALCSDKPASRAVQIANERGVAVIALDPKIFPDRPSFDRALFDAAAAFSPDLIVLAGFMRVVDDAHESAWRGRIINIHPSLLPTYPGLRTHQRVLDAGDATHGASVHFVTPQLDGGPVIARVELSVGDESAAALAARLLPLEHRLLAATMKWIAEGRVRLDGDAVIVDAIRLRAPSRSVSGALHV